MPLFGHEAMCALCSGASGFVQLALDTETDEQVAIKFIERGGRTSQRIIARELLNHRECAMHPHIIQLKVTRARGAAKHPHQRIDFARSHLCQSRSSSHHMPSTDRMLAMCRRCS